MNATIAQHMAQHMPQHMAQQRIPQLCTATLLAALVTSVLFLLMYSLIATDLPELDESITFHFDPVMVPPKPPEIEKTPPPEPVSDPEPQPHFEPAAAELDFDPSTVVSIAGPEPVLEDVTIGGRLGDSGIVPIFRVQPEYPQAALRRGIEGYVDLLFDVTASGKTTNIRIIDASPPGVFERAAMKALKKWKYKPPIENDIPYAQPNMTTRISFALES